MSEEEVTLRIANVNVRVPLCKDLPTTRALAAALEQRMREIEAASSRIDSTAFALRTAFEFASDLHLLREEQEATVHDMALALDKMLTRLEHVADEMEKEIRPPMRTCVVGACRVYVTSGWTWRD